MRLGAYREIKLLAEATAEELTSDLDAGRIPQLNLSQVRRRLLQKVNGKHFTGEELDRLEELTTRLVDEKVG